MEKRSEREGTKEGWGEEELDGRRLGSAGQMGE